MKNNLRDIIILLSSIGVIAVICYSLNILYPTLFKKFYRMMAFWLPHPGSCKILEEKYCKLVSYKPYPYNSAVTMIVGRIPNGAIIFSPTDGRAFIEQLTLSQLSPKPVIHLRVSHTFGTTPNRYNDTYSFISFVSPKVPDNTVVVAGDEIAAVIDDAQEILHQYNLLGTGTRISIFPPQQQPKNSPPPSNLFSNP